MQGQANLQDRRVSSAIPVFNGQINSIDARLQDIKAEWGSVPRYQYLTISAPTATEINNRTIYWKTDLFPRYLNPLTKASVDGLGGAVQTFIRDFRILVTPVLDSIAANELANHDDELAFNLVLERNRKSPTHRTTPIEVQLDLKVEHHGGGKFRCQARKRDDSIGRANIPHEDGANEVELAFHIFPQGTPVNAQISADAIQTRAHFTRALFDFQVGDQYSGQWIVIIPRWTNTHYPQFAGPWGEKVVMVIP